MILIQGPPNFAHHAARPLTPTCQVSSNSGGMSLLSLGFHHTPPREVGWGQEGWDIHSHRVPCLEAPETLASAGDRAGAGGSRDPTGHYRRALELVGREVRGTHLIHPQLSAQFSKVGKEELGTA